MSQSPWILHICERSAWESAQRAGEYRAASLESEGFIHTSRSAQVLWVANQFYRESPPLVLLWIDPGRLAALLKDDPVGEGSFPHVYGPINLDAVVHVTPFLPDPDGVFRCLPTI